MVDSPPGPTDLAQLRHDNALALFDEFVRRHVRSEDAAALRGLERRFAEHVLIQPSYWSQIKSRTRQIGERLARQFEQRCHKPIGWLDLAHELPGRSVGGSHPAPPQSDEPLAASSQPRDDDERFIVGLVLSYYRRHPKRARSRLLDLLGEVLTTPPPEPTELSPPPASPGEDDDHTHWLRSQRGVQPLKQRR